MIQGLTRLALFLTTPFLLLIYWRNTRKSISTEEVRSLVADLGMSGLLEEH